MIRKIIIAAALLCLVCVPITAYAGGEAEAAEIKENYEAAKDNLENIYYGTLKDLSDEGGMLNDSRPFSERAYEWFYRTYRAIADAAPYVIAISIGLGCFIFVLSRKNKRYQRFALKYLIILIPLVLLVIVFAAGASPLFKRV